MSALKSRIRSEPDTGRVQFAGRSETGTKKILTVLKVLKHYIVFRDRDIRTLTTAQSERTRKAREANRGKRNSIPKGVYKPFGR